MSRLSSLRRDSNFPFLIKSKRTIIFKAVIRPSWIQWTASPSPTSSSMLISGPLSSLSLRSSRKEPQLEPIGLLISSAGKEPRRVNRICLWSDRECSPNTSQPVMLSRSPQYPRVISITSCLDAFQNVGSFPWLRISNFIELRNSCRDSPLPLKLVLPHAVWCALVSNPTIKRRFSFTQYPRIPPTPFTGEDPLSLMADKQSKQLAVSPPHTPCTLLGLPQGPYKRILAAPMHSFSSQGYRL